jgi:hypothetical protein
VHLRAVDIGEATLEWEQFVVYPGRSSCHVFLSIRSPPDARGMDMAAIRVDADRVPERWVFRPRADSVTSEG